MRTVTCLVVGLFAAMMIACGGAGSPSADKAAVGRGFNRGDNDLEGRTDSTPRAPIIETAANALKKYFKGRAELSGIPTVKILDSGKSWMVIGRYASPVDKRHDFQSIIRLSPQGDYEAANLMLDDDIVMDMILAKAPKRVVEPAPVRTWTSGKHTVEASFVSKTGDKVKLKKSDGGVLTVDAAKLSEDDLQWIKERK